MGNSIKRQLLIGMPIIQASTGKELGVLGDFLINLEEKTVCGIIILKNTWTKRNKIIPFKNINTIGEYVITVNLDGLLNNIDCFENAISANQIIGIQLLREDGYEIGTISDILINGQDGIIDGYEISKGFLDDLIDGRGVLRFEHAYNAYNNEINAVVISNDRTSEIIPYNKGIKNIFFNKLQ